MVEGYAMSYNVEMLNYLIMNYSSGKQSDPGHFFKVSR